MEVHVVSTRAKGQRPRDARAKNMLKMRLTRLDQPRLTERGAGSFIT